MLAYKIVEDIAKYNEAVGHWTELKETFDKSKNPEEREYLGKFVDIVGNMLVEKIFEMLTSMTQKERWALKLSAGEVPFEMEAGSRRLLSFQKLVIMEDLLS